MEQRSGSYVLRPETDRFLHVPLPKISTTWFNLCVSQLSHCLEGHVYIVVPVLILMGFQTVLSNLSV